MSEELRPCPFCGMNYAENAWDECGSEYWGCEFCGAASGTARDEYDWNTRPIEDTLNKRIAELEEVQRWIPVSERLPEDLQSIIVFTKDRKTYIIRFLELYGREGFGSLSDIVTHWMPLPPNPESPNDTQTQTIVYGKESEE